MRRAVALTLAGLALAGCASDRERDVKANRSLYAQLPRFPGAHLRSETSSARREEDGTILGYDTRFDLSLPPQTTPTSVAAFYRRKLLPKWRLVETLDGPVLNFRRGNASVSINLDNWRVHILEIAVDHSSYAR